MSNLNTNYTVLFVDDEPRVTSALKAIFRRDYNVLTANSGAQALQVLAQHKVDVLVSDQRMPEMLGNELLATVSQQYPQTMRILLTGFMDKAAIVDSINHGEVYRFINKPWNNDEMRSVVAEAALASEHLINDEPESVTSQATTTSQATPEKYKNNAILMIEQEQGIRNQIRKFCGDNKIMIYATQNIEQAIAAVASRESIGLVLVELSNDANKALQAIGLLKRARPEIIAIAITNEIDAHTAVDLINQGQVFKYLIKPLDTDGLQQAIENAFHRHRYLKKHKNAQQRYKVEAPKGMIASKIESIFNSLMPKILN